MLKPEFVSLGPIKVIGGGLAGSEAAWYLANKGHKVQVYEMRPLRMTAAHTGDLLAELVCSNSLKSESSGTAAALLKDELRLYGSVLMQAAEVSRVPAGGALAVDRTLFSQNVTDKLAMHPNIELIREEVLEVGDENTIIAAGPLASGALMDCLAKLTGEQLHFVDAISPIIAEESIDGAKAFFAGRYGKGGDDYLNLPMTEAEYDRFYEALLSAEVVKAHLFEDEKVFEKCMPVEVMAARGRQTLLYGPMRPVGLRDREGNRPFAVVQLRRENREGSAYNIVGFQTKMTIPAQRAVLGLIPGLEHADFLRYGAIHRNTYVNAPAVLNGDFSMKRLPDVYMAGQITGVEGYLESAASGLLAALFMDHRLRGFDAPRFPVETAFGALIGHIKGEFGGGVYSPGNFHFGMLPLPEERIRSKEERKNYYHSRGLGMAKLFQAGMR